MAYSNDLRTRAVNHYLTINRNYKEVSDLFHIGIATLHDWVKRSLTSGSIERKSPPGRPCAVSESDHDELCRMVLSNADSSLRELSEKWHEKSGIQITGMTISRTIRRFA